MISRSAPGRLWPENAARPSLLETDDLVGSFFYDTALSASKAAMSGVTAVTDRSHVVFGSDWPFSALTFTGRGDPAPGLSEVFTASQRREVERLNPLRQLPRLAARLT